MTSFQNTLDLNTPHELLQTRQYGPFSKHILTILDSISIQTITDLSYDDIEPLNFLARLIVTSFTQPDFHIPQQEQFTYIKHAALISNIMVLSSFGTTDIALEKLQNQNADYSKQLPLYTPSNTVRINLTEASKKLPLHTSHWLSRLLQRFQCQCNQRAEEHKSEILNNKSLLDHYIPIATTEEGTTLYNTSTFFYPTYCDSPQEKHIKHTINQTLQKKFPTALETQHANMNKIAIITQYAHKTHAIYKSIFPLLNNLKEEYHLTLLHLEPEIQHLSKLDKTRFDQIIPIDRLTENNITNITKLYEKEKFGITFYPDIGLNPNSIVLSNMRLSPIQISCPGQPVSTFGSKIDYYISGQRTETIEAAQTNYSERLVAIPGSGALPITPTYKPKNPKPDNDTIIISLAWGTLKMHYPYVQHLKSILDKTSKAIKLRFATLHTNDLCFFPLTNDLVNLFGKDHIEVTGFTHYNEYMYNIETCHFGIDSYPFGGYNRIIDTLHCNRPIIARQGDKLYNTLSAYILNQIGLSELIATTNQELTDITIKLIENNNYREQIIKHIKETNLKKVLSDTDHPYYFKKAIDYLVKHHNTLQQDHIKSPIIIQRDNSDINVA